MIPSLDQLVATVLARATHADSILHGPQHWQAVTYAGLYLAAQTPTTDKEIVFLFGLLHDAMRENDGHDPQHGRRAAALARELNGAVFTLPVAALATLCVACDDHDRGLVSVDPTIGCCWDADRLNLWRVGIQPDPHLLSIQAGRGALGWSRGIYMGTYTWADLYARCL